MGGLARWPMQWVKEKTESREQGGGSREEGGGRHTVCSGSR